MPARKVLKRPAAAKKRPSSGKSGKSGWATYRAKEELARIRTDNELRQLKKERAELQSPPLGLNAAFISAVKKEELQKDPAEELAAIQKDHPAEELPAIQNVKEELSEELAAIQNGEEELSLQDTAVQTPKNWAKELSRRNLKILSTRMVQDGLKANAKLRASPRLQCLVLAGLPASVLMVVTTVMQHMTMPSLALDAVEKYAGVKTIARAFRLENRWILNQFLDMEDWQVRSPSIYEVQVVLETFNEKLKDPE
ncbi:OTUD4 [Symbiodinium necroappetens]|uniref:OTUD4 protein n=1 Tax=Symbiodinium necroappetens TaxID=1628268 RepID=A0A812KDY2_9DINO|nr:OTUD4 [Symbiodinium necroappetens]